jgi:hypothetical protein
VLAPLLADQPALAADVVFGVRASALLAERFEAHVLASWAAGRTSLRRPLPPESSPSSPESPRSLSESLPSR